MTPNKRHVIVFAAKQYIEFYDVLVWSIKRFYPDVVVWLATEPDGSNLNTAVAVSNEPNLKVYNRRFGYHDWPAPLHCQSKHDFYAAIKDQIADDDYVYDFDSDTFMTRPGMFEHFEQFELCGCPCRGDQEEKDWPFSKTLGRQWTHLSGVCIGMKGRVFKAVASFNYEEQMAKFKSEQWAPVWDMFISFIAMQVTSNVGKCTNIGGGCGHDFEENLKTTDQWLYHFSGHPSPRYKFDTFLPVIKDYKKRNV